MEEPAISELLRDEPITDEKFNLQTLPGIGADTANMLKSDGIDTVDDLLELGEKGLQKYRGVGKHKAEMIISAIESMNTGGQ